MIRGAVRRHRKRLAWLSLLEWGGFLLIAAWRLGPALFEPRTSLVSSGTGDAVRHVWTLWWVAWSTWEQHRLPLYTGLLDYPRGLSLWLVDGLDLPAALLLPHWLGPVASYNLLVLAWTAATGLCTARLLVHLGFSRGLSWVGGAVAMSLPQLHHAASQGTVETLSLAVVPLAFGGLLRLLYPEEHPDAGMEPIRRPTESLRAGALGGAVAIGFLLHGAFLAFMVLPALLAAGRRRLWAARRSLVIAGLLALGLALGPLAAFRATTLAPQRTGASDAVSDGRGIDLAGMVDRRPLPGARAAATPAYSGIALFALAAVGLARATRPVLLVAAAGAAGLALSLGGRIFFSGWPLTGPASPWSPATWLGTLTTLGQEPLVTPARALPVALVCLVPLAAEGARTVAALLRRPGWGAGVLSLAALDLAQSGGGRWRFPVDAAPVYDCLRAGPQGPVAELPWVVNRRAGAADRTLWMQMGHAQPTSAQPFRRLSDPSARHEWQDDPALVPVLETLEGFRTDVDPESVAAVARFLRGQGFRSLLLPGDAWSQSTADGGAVRACRDVVQVDLTLDGPEPVAVPSGQTP